MKTKRILLFFALLCSFQLAFSQAFSAEDYLETYFITSQAEVLGITNVQLQQIAEMEKAIENEWQEDINSGQDIVESYNERRIKQLKIILSKDQFDQLLSLAQEKFEEQRLINYESKMKDVNWKVPDLNMTLDQAEHYYQLMDSIKSGLIPEFEEQMIYGPEGELNLMKRVLRPEQFILYKTGIEARRRSSNEKFDDKMRTELPIMKELAKLYIEDFGAKLQVLRARFESELSPSDQIKVKHFRELTHRIFDLELEEAQNRANGLGGSFGISDSALKKEFEELMIYMMDGFKKVPFLVESLNSQGLDIVDDETIVRMIAMAKKYTPQMLKQEIAFKTLFAETAKKHKKIIEKFREANVINGVVAKAPEFKVNELEALKFLLTTPAELEEELATKADAHLAKAFPSPAKTFQTLEFELRQSSPVQIEIIDQKGQIIQNVFSGSLGVGVHQMNVDVQQLDGTIFYYRITSNSGTSTLNILIAK